MMNTTPVEPGSSSRYSGRGPSIFATYSRELALIGLMLFIIVLFSVLFPRTFFSWDNFAAILRNLAFEGLLAIGMMILLVSGSFDLSVGAMASMIGVITGWLMKEAGWSVPAAVAGGLAVAAVAGAINGTVVAYLKVNALITTLGTMGIFKGIALLIGGPGITFLPESFSRFGRYELFGIQSPVWVMAVVAISLHLALSHSRFFRQYYYIGANAHAARLSGIHVERMQVVAFTVVGLIAGLAGIVYASRIATATATVGDGAELKAITAVILGGASLYGGKGTIWGALLGVFFTALIQNVLIILAARYSFRPEWQGIVMGLVLVLAVALDSLLTGRRTQ